MGFINVLPSGCSQPGGGGGTPKNLLIVKGDHCCDGPDLVLRVEDCVLTRIHAEARAYTSMYARVLFSLSCLCYVGNCDPNSHISHPEYS